MSRVYPMSVGALFHFFMVLCLGATLKAKPLWIAAGLDAVEKENELKHPLALTPCVWEGHTAPTSTSSSEQSQPPASREGRSYLSLEEGF